MTVKRIALLVGLVATGLAGCVHPQVYNKPGSTAQSFAQDKLTCMQTSYGSVPGQMAFGPPLFVAMATAAHNQEQQNMFQTCMEAQGYTRTQ